MPRFGDRRRARIGLLGGSFNPAHAGHLHVARAALRSLKLDQVWLLVSPGNVLKPPDGMARFEDRLASARHLADGRRIIATDLEARLGGSRFTVDTARRLKRRFPRVCFVWLMGADILEQLPRWRRWRAFTRMMPFAVLPRPHYSARALAGRAAKALRKARLAARAAPRLACARRPAWVYLPIAEHHASATAIRSARKGGAS